MKLIIVLALAANAATGIPEPVTRAYANMSPQGEVACSFTRSFRDGETNSLERYDASSGNWSLLQIDGREPDSDDLEDYDENREERAERTFPTSMEFDDLAASDSYKLLRESESVMEYEFAPAPESEEDEKIMDALVGRLTLDTGRQSVVSVEVSNVKPFSPAMGVKVKTMNQKVVYRHLVEHELYVIDEVTIEVAGRAFGLKKIAQDASVKFDNFSCVR